MLKKIPLFVFLIISVWFTQVFANWESFEERAGGKTIRAVWRKGLQRITFESASPSSYAEYVSALSQLPLKDGYPAVSRAAFNFNRNQERQQAGNPYHLWQVSSENLAISQRRGRKPFITPLGFVQFGPMPTKGYPEGTREAPTLHHPILEKFMKLGITKKRHPAGGWNDRNIERMENRGLIQILPIFDPRASFIQRKNVLQAAYEGLKELRRRGRVLPGENTRPHAAMALHHPQDSIGRLLVLSGFSPDDHPGFGWFYPQNNRPQPRTMYTRSLEGAQRMSSAEFWAAFKMVRQYSLKKQPSLRMSRVKSAQVFRGLSKVRRLPAVAQKSRA